MTAIELRLPDDQAGALKAKAAAGLTLEDWPKYLASQSAAEQPERPFTSG